MILILVIQLLVPIAAFTSGKLSVPPVEVECSTSGKLSVPPVVS